MHSSSNQSFFSFPSFFCIFQIKFSANFKLKKNIYILKFNDKNTCFQLCIHKINVALLCFSASFMRANGKSSKFPKELVQYNKPDNCVVFCDLLVLWMKPFPHKVLTYVEYRLQNSVWRLPPLHPPLHAASVSSPRTKGGGGTHSPGGEGVGGGQLFWKTPDIGFASYSIISLRFTPPPHPRENFSLGNDPIKSLLGAEHFLFLAAIAILLRKLAWESPLSVCHPPFSCGKCKEDAHLTVGRDQWDQWKAPKCSVCCTQLYAWQPT